MIIWWKCSFISAIDPRHKVTCFMEEFCDVTYLWFIGRIACTQCMRCGLLLQMSHVAWSVCLSVLDTRVSCAKRLNRSRCSLGGRLADQCWSKEPCVRCGSRSDESIRSREGWQDGDANSFCWHGRYDLLRGISSLAHVCCVRYTVPRSQRRRCQHRYAEVRRRGYGQRCRIDVTHGPVRRNSPDGDTRRRRRRLRSQDYHDVVQLDVVAGRDRPAASLKSDRPTLLPRVIINY